METGEFTMICSSINMNNVIRKEISGDGSYVKIYYYNGDVKETSSSGLVRYLYNHTQTLHTTHTDGREVLQFNNGQEEVGILNR